VQSPLGRENGTVGMKIKYFCSWWGLENLSIPLLLEKIKWAGYDGVEIGDSCREVAAGRTHILE
jgi:sugar phosphate isomerase/epimerase